MRTHSSNELAYLIRQGVDRAVMGELELALEMTDYTLRSLGVAEERCKLIMKTGFEQLMKAYPDSHWNLNHFALFACRARDADTYRRLRKQIGDRPYDAAWPDNLSIEVCDERLTKPI